MKKLTFVKTNINVNKLHDEIISLKASLAQDMIVEHNNTQVFITIKNDIDEIIINQAILTHDPTPIRFKTREQYIDEFIDNFALMTNAQKKAHLRRIIGLLRPEKF